jgi:hypothetical protein
MRIGIDPVDPTRSIDFYMLRARITVARKVARRGTARTVGESRAETLFNILNRVCWPGKKNAGRRVHSGARFEGFENRATIRARRFAVLDRFGERAGYSINMRAPATYSIKHYYHIEPFNSRAAFDMHR